MERFLVIFSSLIVILFLQVPMCLRQVRGEVAETTFDAPGNPNDTSPTTITSTVTSNPTAATNTTSTDTTTTTTPTTTTTTTTTPATNTTTIITTTVTKDPPTTANTNTTTTSTNTTSSATMTSIATTDSTKSTATSTTSPAHDGEGQHFDAASFIGGIILCGGVLAIVFFGLKFYNNRKDRSYHTL